MKQRIAVIGAGVFGASAAFHLAAAGADVVAIDPDLPGRATAAGAGIICPWVSAAREEAWHQIAEPAARYYPELIARLGERGTPDTSYCRVGALCVDAEPASLDRTETFVRAALPPPPRSAC